MIGARLWLYALLLSGGAVLFLAMLRLLCDSPRGCLRDTRNEGQPCGRRALIDQKGQREGKDGESDEHRLKTKE